MRRLSLLLILALTLGGCTPNMAPSQSDVLPAPSATPPVSAPEETVDPSPLSLYLLRDWETSDYTVLDREGNALLPRTYDRVDRISEDRLAWPSGSLATRTAPTSRRLSTVTPCATSRATCSLISNIPA